MVDYVIQRLKTKDIRHYKDSLADLLQDVVNNGASVSFLPPLGLTTALEYWQKIAAEVLAQERFVLGAIADGKVVGCVHLSLASVPNGQHRAEVQKVLVHTDYRRLGIARAMMLSVEDLAREIQRNLLILDTVRGSSAEALYQQLGWERLGVVPRFALLNNELIDTVFYYKEV